MRKVTFNPLFCLLFFFFGNLISQNSAQSIDNYLDQLIQNKKITTEDAQWILTGESLSRVSNVHHSYYRQVLNGVEIYGTESGLHTLQNGNVISANNHFVKNMMARNSGSSSPSLSAIQAAEAAANQLNYNITQPLLIISQENNSGRATILSNGGISLSPIPAKLVYQLNDKEELRLCWDISIQEKAQENWWSVRIDATTGAIIDQVNWMVTCAIEHNHSDDLTVLDYNANLYDIPNYKDLVSTASAGCNECYEVIAMPIESPYYGIRTIETLPANLTASPFGWHDTNGAPGAEFTTTQGNNVSAYEDGNNPGYQPDAGASLSFTGYPFSEIYSNANQYEDAAITNLFYWNNIIHDLLYQYGFDEAGGNFQENNYGNGGAGSDYVNAEAQDGSGTCNANFGTPPDGSNPTMQMYVCGDKDGDFDNLVIVHEYGHGISNRLTGGPNNTGCLSNQEQMGEGWSDFYGVLMTIEAGDLGTDTRGVGTYLFGQGAGGPGIRPFPYSTDLAVNPQTYDYIKTAAVPHGVGSVWATTMWEISWALIDEYGFDTDFYNFTGDVNLDAGNIQAFALVTEGMKLQPCSPGFVDGRDAIFAADLAIYGGANECLLWEAFAKRGLGYSADQGSSGSRSDGTEAFDMPITTINTAESVCVSQGIQTYGGGSPIGGVYSGPGVTDDGNGLTYSFDPAVAGIGTHTITYDAVSLCSTTTTATDTLEVTDDIPEILCQDVTLELDANGEAILEIADVVTNLEPGALVVDQTGTFSPINITGTGTTVSLGDDQLSGAITIGFDFSFYGQSYTSFYISSNGFISFENGGDSGCCSGEVIPSAGGIDNYIALVWEDLNPSAGGTIRYETVGTAPDRKLVLEYDAVPFYGTSDNVTTQLHLFETSNRIEIHTLAAPANGNTTQGIENGNGSSGLATPGRNSQTWSANNDYVAFYYLPGGPADNCGASTTISLSQTLFTCNDLGANVITVTITDANNNSASCTPTVTITDPLGVCVLGVEENELSAAIRLFPNPTNGQLTLINNTTAELRSAVITDVNGRTIQTVDLSDAGVSTEFSIEALASGMYFVKINTATTSIVKRVVKQ